MDVIGILVSTEVRKTPQAKVASLEMFFLSYLKDVAVGSSYI